jgi:hypothetical protein
MSKKPRKPAKARKPAVDEEEPPLSAWARLSKGTKALLALIGTTVIAAVVPGVLPYASDRVLDLFHKPIVTLTSTITSADGLQEAAAEVVATVPGATTDLSRDPRFVPAGYAVTRLTLEGKRSGTVSILDAMVEIDARLPPRQGTLVSIPSQGETDNTDVDLNLDAPQPTFANRSGGGPYFVGKHITLDRGEVWVISVQSRTTRHEYAWRLHLRLRYRGADRELVIPPATSPPLRMTAFVAPAAYQRQIVWDHNGRLVLQNCTTARAACAATKLPVVQAPG